MSRQKKKSGVPERWLKYWPVGRRVPGTRFIAFKVPLKPSLNRRVSDSDSFGLWDLLDLVEDQQQELGLIVDLTFTGRYYSLTDVPQSCSYIKILTAGRHVPSDGVILDFKRAVRSFLNQNRDNDRLIGVHCTHGLNRTGYLVCRYLIDVDGLEPQAALELFNSCRGHSIERRNYMQDLRSATRRSNAGIEDPQQQPSRGLATQRPPRTRTHGLKRELKAVREDGPPRVGPWGELDRSGGPQAGLDCSGGPRAGLDRSAQPKEKPEAANQRRPEPSCWRGRHWSCDRSPQAGFIPTYQWNPAQQTKAPPPV